MPRGKCQGVTSRAWTLGSEGMWAQISALPFMVMAVSKSAHFSVATELGSLNTHVQPISPLPSSILELRELCFPVSLTVSDIDPANKLELESW